MIRDQMTRVSAPTRSRSGRFMRRAVVFIQDMCVCAMRKVQWAHAGNMQAFVGIFLFFPGAAFDSLFFFFFPGILSLVELLCIPGRNNVGHIAGLVWSNHRSGVLLFLWWLAELCAPLHLEWIMSTRWWIIISKGSILQKSANCNFSPFWSHPWLFRLLLNNICQKIHFFVFWYQNLILFSSGKPHVTRSDIIMYQFLPKRLQHQGVNQSSMYNGGQQSLAKLRLLPQ